MDQPTNPVEQNDQAAAPAQPQPQQSAIQIDDSKAIPLYSNFCRVTGTPEELIIDFGLNPQPFGPSSVPIVVTQRITMNFYTGKRMFQALGMTLQRHEATFGLLETDVNRRVQPGMLRQQQAQAQPGR